MILKCFLWAIAGWVAIVIIGTILFVITGNPAFAYPGAVTLQAVFFAMNRGN